MGGSLSVWTSNSSLMRGTPEQSPGESVGEHSESGKDDFQEDGRIHAETLR